jgi:menaquinone-dependent protoporphyrinogen IX oxidase
MCKRKQYQTCIVGADAAHCQWHTAVREKVQRKQYQTCIVGADAVHCQWHTAVREKVQRKEVGIQGLNNPMKKQITQSYHISHDTKLN